MATKYSTWNRGQEKELLNKLGGKEIAERILTCDSVDVTFSDGKAEVVATDLITSIWKTITIGNVPRDQFGSTRSMIVSDWSADMMKQDAFTVVSQEEQIDLVVVSVAELGFKEATHYDVIYQRAKERDLELCPAEVGPQLRLQYTDQPLNEWLIIAMEAIRDSGDALSVFRVGHDDDGLWLNGDFGNPGDLWNPDRRFVFRTRKQPLAA